MHPVPPHRQRQLGSLLLVFLLLFLVPLAVGAHDPATPAPVSIPDSALAEAIRSALDKPDGELTASDMESLTALDASGLGIADLTGLERAINLTELDLTHNEIIDISPLAHLTQLRSLTLDRNLVHDLRPLVENPGLGSGDTLSLGATCVDFDRDSPDMDHLFAVVGRGVEVGYDESRICLHGPVRGWRGGGAQLAVHLHDRRRRTPVFTGELRPDGEFGILLNHLNGDELTTAEGILLHDQDACQSSVTVSDPTVQLNAFFVITVLDGFNSVGSLLLVNEPLESLPDPMVSAAYVFATGPLEVRGTATCTGVFTNYRYELQLEPGWQRVVITVNGFGTGSQRLAAETKELPHDLAWTILPE